MSDASPRKASVERATRETTIRASLNLDGSGRIDVETPIGFFSHMLEALGRHALLDLELRVEGDTHVDQHHTVEDTGLVIGQAIAKALGDRGGIRRAGWARHPMDEALADVALDLAGRAHVVWNASFERRHAGELDLDVIPDFFEALARGLGANLHIDLVRGRSDHHKLEAIFKATARALRDAVTIEPRLGGASPSTKGSLDV